MKKIFDLDGTVYKTLSKGYMLLKLNIFFFVFSLPIFTLGSFINVVAKRIDENDDEFTIVEIIRDIINRKRVLKIWMEMLLVLIILIVITSFLPKELLFVCLMVLSIYSLICINGLIAGDFSKDKMVEIVRIPSVVTMKYIGIFCGIAILYIVPPFILFFLPRLLIFWFLFGISLPFYIHIKIYKHLERKLILSINKE